MTKKYNKRVKSLMLLLGTALCSVADVSAGAPPLRASVVNIIDNATLSSGDGTDPEQSFVSGSTISYHGNYTVTDDRTGFPIIKAIDLNGFAPGIFSICCSASVGSIVDNLNKGSKLSITITEGKTLTLIGTASTVDSYGFNAAANDYSALASIDFLNDAAILKIDSSDTNVITLNNQFLNASNSQLILNSDLIITDPSVGSFSNISGTGRALTINTTNHDVTIFNNSWNFNGRLNILTPVIAKDASFYDIGNNEDCYTAIGSSETPSILVLEPETDIRSFGEMRVSYIYYGNSNSILGLTSLASPFTYNAGASASGGSIIDTDGVVTPTDLAGVLIIVPQVNEFVMIGASLGNNENHRLKELQIVGNTAANLHLPVFTGALTLNSSAAINFFEPVALGVNGTMTINQNAEIHDLVGAIGGVEHEMEHTISGESTTINLDTNTMYLRDGHLLLTGTPTINTTYDSTTHNGGSIVIDSGNTVPSEFDFSSSTSMQVVLTANSKLPEHGDNYQYNLFSSVNGGTITPMVDSKAISFTSNEENSLLIWSYDPTTYVLSSKVDAPAIIPIVVNNEASRNAVIIAQALISSDANQNEASRAILSNIGQMTDAQMVEALERLVPNDTTTIALTEATDLAGGDVADRLLINIPLDINLAEANDVAAGNEIEVTKYGAWVSPFYQKSIQKKTTNSSGYKVANYGGTVGYDYMVKENLTLGLAWSFVESDLKHQDTKIKDKAKTKTNIISLYGLANLNNGIYLSGSTSFGFGNVHSIEERIITDTITEAAVAKYKTNAYLAQIQGGKQYSISDKIAAIPSLGLRYVQFNSDSYKEKGSVTHQLGMNKKTSYHIDTIIGSRLNTNYYTEQNFKLTPELSAYAYINLKRKSAKTRITSEAFSNPITLNDAKISKAWYSLGTALGVSKGMVEFNLAYDAQLDKKYISHQGMFKVRVNF